VSKPRKPVAAKYRNAATNETWSGRGRVPKWLAAELAKGRKREEFAVG
jgi:DNA-binding protein H-NS